MKGTLHKTEKGWQVCNIQATLNGPLLQFLPLHPDDCKRFDINGDSQSCNIEFEIVVNQSFEITNNGLEYFPEFAKILTVRIGIGCTTYNRPKIKKLWLENYLKYTEGDNIKLYIAEDTDLDRKGIAARKNECLRALRDCDYVFLFDDDCFPIKKGWTEFFINSGFKHLLYLNNQHDALGFNGDGIVYANCGGVFMFMTKECIDAVGAFDEKYGMYGFEHADYSIRIHNAGITVHQYTSLTDTHKYLYSLDYAENNTSSITDAEKQIHVKNNWDKFFKEHKKTYIHL